MLSTADDSKYQWVQSDEDVTATFALPEGVDQSSLTVDVKAQHLCIKARGHRPLIDAPLRFPVKVVTGLRGPLVHPPPPPPFDIVPQGTLSLRRALRRPVWVTIPEYRRNSAAYIHAFVTSCLPPPPHTTFFLLFDCYIPFFGPLSFRNGAFDSVPNAGWAHNMVVVEEPPLILFPGLTLGTPKMAGVM